MKLQPPRYATYVVADKYTGKVHSEHVTRAQARSAKDAAADFRLRVRGGKRLV